MEGLTIEKLREASELLGAIDADEPIERHYFVHPEYVELVKRIDVNQAKWFGLKGVLIRMLLRIADKLEKVIDKLEPDED